MAPQQKTPPTLPRDWVRRASDDGVVPTRRPGASEVGRTLGVDSLLVVAAMVAADAAGVADVPAKPC